jgi:hypothetical protein
MNERESIGTSPYISAKDRLPPLRYQIVLIPSQARSRIPWIMLKAPAITVITVHPSISRPLFEFRQRILFFEGPGTPIGQPNEAASTPYTLQAAYRLSDKFPHPLNDKTHVIRRNWHMRSTGNTMDS